MASFDSLGLERSSKEEEVIKALNRDKVPSSDAFSMEFFQVC